MRDEAVIALLLVLVIASAGAGYYVGNSGRQTTTTTSTVTKTIGNDSATIDIFPLRMVVTWNASTVTHYGEWVSVNATVTNVSNKPVTVPCAPCVSDLSIVASNGSKVGMTPPFEVSAGWPVQVTLNSSQQLSIFYRVGFPSQPVRSTASAYTPLVAQWYMTVAGLGNGQFTLNVTIWIPGYPVSNQYQVVSIPLEVAVESTTDPSALQLHISVYSNPNYQGAPSYYVDVWEFNTLSVMNNVSTTSNWEPRGVFGDAVMLAGPWEWKCLGGTTSPATCRRAVRS